MGLNKCGLDLIQRGCLIEPLIVYHATEEYYDDYATDY
jgi:hypothetical protein